jgi:hypothetical protein
MRRGRQVESITLTTEESERQIRRGTHRSTVELERAIRDYLSVSNREPIPFVRTKTTDQILERIKRFVMRISNSGYYQGSNILTSALEHYY